jgi:hypothetical protein
MKGLACVLLLLAASGASAQEVPEYRDVRAARPDGRTVPVNGLTLVRDSFRIDLRSGAVHLVAPLGGDTFAAVFLGEGGYELTPATAAERRHLQLVTGNASLETLTDRFTRLVLLFTDRTAAEILGHAPAAQGAPDPEATRAFENYLARQQSGKLPNLHLRLLADLLNRPARADGVFLAYVEGQAHPPALLAVDPLGMSNLTSRFSFFGGEEVALVTFDHDNAGVWYLSALAASAVGGRGKPTRGVADATHYEIETTLDGGSIRGVTTITARPLTDGLRMMSLHIFPKLRIRRASLERDGAAVPLAIIHDEIEQGWWSRVTGGEVADADVGIVFPEPLARDEDVRVRLEYDGSDVLEGANGQYSVRARASWYPNLGTFSDVATYGLTFRFGGRNQLVSVGELVSERTEGGQKVAVWKSDVPMRVAGFNYGQFRKRSQDDKESGVAVDVYTHPDRSQMAGTALADAMNTSRVGKAYFGAPPFRRLSITQQVEANFGQSWPSLVYLPPTALLTSTDFAFANVDPRALASLKEFANTVGWHEVAHQWWGHEVGWASYRDQWLSEGFAEFTAALVLELSSGRDTADRFWELRRLEVLDRGQGAVPNDEAGAITQGFRLATTRSPAASSALLYSKGAFVVHMLRMMMREDGAAEPDAAFRAMMHDFVKTWAGRNPSTDDFQAVSERHMTPRMNLTGDGRLTWFFDQWVHGTHVPTLTSALEAADLGGGRYRIAGTIAQAGVPEGFRSLVPIYLDFGNGRLTKIGTVPMSGTAVQKMSAELELPQRPRRVLINGRHDVLSR